MKRAKYLLSVLVLMPVLLCGIVACKSNLSSLDESTVREYADPATETTLQGLSENNREKYVQYGNDSFKTGFNLQIIEATAAQINVQLGKYQSKEFVSIEKLESYIVVHYKAKYEMGEISVRMVFDKDHLVAGQSFE